MIFRHKSRSINCLFFLRAAVFERKQTHTGTTPLWYTFMCFYEITNHKNNNNCSARYRSRWRFGATWPMTIETRDIRENSQHGDRGLVRWNWDTKKLPDMKKKVTAWLTVPVRKFWLAVFLFFQMFVTFLCNRKLTLREIKTSEDIRQENGFAIQILFRYL